MANGSLETTDEDRKKVNALAKRLTVEASMRNPLPTAEAAARKPQPTEVPVGAMTAALAMPTTTPTSPAAAPAAPAAPAPAAPAPAPYGKGSLGTPDLSSAKSFFSNLAPPYGKSSLGTPDLSSAKSFFSNLDNGPATPRLDSGPVTPGLDRLAAMQKAPFGSANTLHQTRSLESAEGKSLRAARKLQRLGFGKAAEQMAFAGVSQNMDEPNIKSQEYRGFEEKSKRAAMGEAAANEDLKRRQFQFQNKLLQQQNKDLESGQFDYRKYAPSA